MLGIYTEGYSSKGFEKSMIAQYFVLFKIIRNMIHKRVKNNQMEKKSAMTLSVFKRIVSFQ